MASEDHVKEFPDVSQKLAAPKKLSAFEKERQAAEAKKQRDEAENAAALKAFEESFATENDNRSASRGQGGSLNAPTGPRDVNPPTGPRGAGFGTSLPIERAHDQQVLDQMNAPGAFAPFSGAPLQPPSLKRKRALDEMREHQEALREQAILDNPSEELVDESNVDESEERPQDDAPRPTVFLSSLPPSMGVDDVKILLRDFVNVHSVRFMSNTSTSDGGRLSMSAIATLSSDTPTIQIDNAVSALKDNYLGFGFYLSISRHLSSASLHQSMLPQHASAKNFEPFGADKRRDTHDRFSKRAAPPPMDQRGFMPPESYDTPRQNRRGPAQQDATVTVRPPLSFEIVKAIHGIVDRLLLEPDPKRALELEAMLMALPEVQRDERFAFLYDSRSLAGVYYRFCLWASEYPEEELRLQKRRLCGPERLFQDTPIDFLPPYIDVPFPDLDSLAHVVTDIDYVSSDEESDDEEAERKFNSGREGSGPTEESDKKHLTPLQYARLTYLLSRLPTSNSRLRKGDVARVTNFAITHAAQDAEEIVNMLILNVHKPFAYSLASHYESSNPASEDEEAYEPDETLSTLETGTPDPSRAQLQDSRRDDDSSNAKLVALYVISDILSASSTAGARNAWKYRQIFEAGFRKQKTFEHLGKLDKELAWGRMKSEQWKRKINVVFGIWEGWSVFPNEVHEELKKSFLEPPLSAEEKAEAEAQRLRDEVRRQEGKAQDRLKGTDGSGSASPAPATKERVTTSTVDAPWDGSASTRVAGSARDSDSDHSGKRPAIHADTSSANGRHANHANDISHRNASGHETATKVAVSLTPKSGESAIKKANAPRRMRAEDMFGNSDEE